MKKAIVAGVACFSLLLAGCSHSVQIVNDLSATDGAVLTDTVNINDLSPATADVTVPVSVFMTMDEVDESQMTEIMEADAMIGGLGADKIYRMDGYDFYEFTSGETPVTICSWQEADYQVYVAYYYDGILVHLNNNNTTWYYDNGEVTFVEITTTSPAGGEVYSFYNPDGSKICMRAGDEFYDENNEQIEHQQTIDELREKLSSSPEMQS